MRPTEAYIPPNMNSDNAFQGISYRNIVEAAILVGADFMLFSSILFFAPVIPRIIIGVLLGLLLGAFGLFGVNGEPLSGFLLSFLVFGSTKCVVKLKMPMPHMLTDAERKEMAAEEKRKAKEEAREKKKEKKEKSKKMFSKIFGEK